MDILAKALRDEIVYPEAMRYVDRGIQGDGFYPGAKGFTSKAFPCRGIMLLGRDFGTWDYYQGLSGLPPQSENCPTWTRVKLNYLQPLFRFPVFLTNYLMGVRKEPPATGNIRERLSQSEWSQYESSCWRFLQRQLEYQQPQAVIVLGTDNKSDLNQVSRLSSSFKGVPVSYMRHPYSLIRTLDRKEHASKIARLIATLES